MRTEGNKREGNERKRNERKEIKRNKKIKEMKKISIRENQNRKRKEEIIEQQECRSKMSVKILCLY